MLSGRRGCAEVRERRVAAVRLCSSIQMRAGRGDSVAADHAVCRRCCPDPRRSVWERPHRIIGEGDTPRGRYAWVGCEGALNYRVEFWADKNTYTVRPWIDGIDDLAARRHGALARGAPSLIDDPRPCQPRH